jgi:hypothetical protein
MPPAGVLREAQDGFCEALATDGRSVQVSDERADGVGRLLFGRADAVQIFEHGIRLALEQALLGHFDLQREAEEHLGEVVVEICRDLHPFVLPLFRHPVRQRPHDSFPVFELFARLLKGQRSEEHLACE